MATTFVKIASVTVGAGGSSTIDFTSIPQTYTDLKLVISARNDGAATERNIFFKFNGATTNMSYRALQGNGSAASSFSSATDLHAGDMPAANATASVFGNAEIYIPNYTSANNKSASADGVAENNTTAAIARLVANLWSNTAAITSITLYTNAGNYAQYSTAVLYGIKSS